MVLGLWGFAGDEREFWKSPFAGKIQEDTISSIEKLCFAGMASQAFSTS
jgi:hypothetical protein